jgi:hypothetical protein
MQAITPQSALSISMCGLYIGKIMGMIIMFIMPLANYHATTQHSHEVITDFHDL